MNFPRNIFQTWKTKDVPENWKEGQQSVISMNPNWKYTLLTDIDNDTIVKNNFPDFYQTFISFKYPIQRADAIRYCVLYLYGGIYLDLDYICNKTFDNLILNKEVGLIKSTNTHNIFTNSFLVSQKSSEFWLKCIEQMKQPLPFYKKITKHFEIMNNTGPFLINNIAKQNLNYIEILYNIVNSNCNVCNIKMCDRNNNHYLTPIEGKSWNSLDSTILNFIFCNIKIIILIILIIIILIIIIKKK